MEYEQERNFLVGLLCEDHELAKIIGGELGTPGQSSDLQFYDRLDEDLKAVFCAIDAVGYPDKLKSLIQTMMITKFHVMLIDISKGLSAANAEILVLMDIFTKIYQSIPIFALCDLTGELGYLLDSRIEELDNILEGTSMKNASKITIQSKDDRKKIKQEILNRYQQNSVVKEEDDVPIVLIDHCFPVKGIGTVILGTMKSGFLKVNDMLTLIGLDKKVIIRSIQKHDRDFKSAVAGERVGLAVKGVKSESISRDIILSKSDLFLFEDELNLKVTTISFYKHPVSPESERQFTLFSNLASSPFKVTKGAQITPGNSGNITIKLTNPIPVEKQHPLAIIAELNKFHNQLRIVGYGKILL
ncbi:MAG: hypothetical protein GF364_17450 [Candidatus Lokiarchaeota archaeon]|nr:hypothetical protein [Candidatus Lokiarchaeota archaeon]